MKRKLKKLNRRNKMYQGLIAYQEKKQLGLMKEPKRLDPIQKAEQNPNSLRFAINAKCYNCSGFSKVDVTNCEMTDCELYHLRPWQKPHIKSEANDDGAISEKSIMKKYACSDHKISQERYNSEGVLFTPYARLKKNPKSLRAAINAHCFWCCCEQYKEVKYCPDIRQFYSDKIESCSDKIKSCTDKSKLKSYKAELKSYKAELRTAKNCPLHHLRPWQ